MGILYGGSLDLPLPLKADLFSAIIVFLMIGGNEMATTLESSSHAKSGGRDYDMSLWYDSKWYKFGLITMLAVACFWIWYQRTFAYSHGMDSMEPEFEKVWMGLWRVHRSVLPLCGLICSGGTWETGE